MRQNQLQTIGVYYKPNHEARHMFLLPLSESQEHFRVKQLSRPEERTALMKRVYLLHVKNSVLYTNRSSSYVQTAFQARKNKYTMEKQR